MHVKVSRVSKQVKVLADNLSLILNPGWKERTNSTHMPWHTHEGTHAHTNKNYDDDGGDGDDGDMMKMMMITYKR